MFKIDKINVVTPDEVINILREEDKNVVVVDVREKEEVEQGIIKQAIHIPLNEIPDSIYMFDNGKHYILVCRSGNRSNTAAVFLKEKGFNVSNMIGGMLEWQGEVKY